MLHKVLHDQLIHRMPIWNWIGFYGHRKGVYEVQSPSAPMHLVWSRFWRGGVLERDLRPQSLRFAGSYEFHLLLLLYCSVGLVPGI